MTRTAVVETNLPDIPCRRGKVRDVYDLGDRLLIVATDRVSAFDWVLPNGIPDKGRVLTALSRFWFDLLGVPNHIISTDVEGMELPPHIDRQQLVGRSMLVHKAEVVPIECVARGYLAGSGWREYQQDATVCGLPLPVGLTESDRLQEPIFTPATKAEWGHDENISFQRMADSVGQSLSEELRRRTLDIYAQGVKHAETCGIILADTKFEWGHVNGELMLVDEVLTPDSSRFWPANDYQPGRPQVSYDKQFVRDWLDGTTWDKNSPPPELPANIVEQTRDKYIEAYERLTGSTFSLS